MSIYWWEKTIHDLPLPSLTFHDLPWPSMTFYDLLSPSKTSMIIKCLLSRPGLISGPLQSSPVQINSHLNPRLDPFDSKSYFTTRKKTSLPVTSPEQLAKLTGRAGAGGLGPPNPIQATMESPVRKPATAPVCLTRLNIELEHSRDT